jgi:hypothetical protein
MIRPATSASFAFLLAACATPASDSRTDIPRVTIRELIAHPERWDGREVRVRGLAIRDFEDSNLYESYAEYCRGFRRGRHWVSVGVNWPADGTNNIPRNRTMVIVRGTFTDIFGSQPDGSLRLSNAMSNGPIENPVIVRHLSLPYPRCRR